MHLLIRLLIVSSVLIIGCKQPIEDPYAYYFGSPAVGEVAENIEIFYSDSGYVQVRIKAPVLIRTLEAGLTTEDFPDGVSVEFLDRYGRVNSWLSAKKGTRKPNEKLVVLRDSVVMYNTQDESIRSNELIWTEKDGSIYTTKYVEITRPGEIIKGFGFKTNERMTEYEINAVTGRIKSGDLESDFQ